MVNFRHRQVKACANPVQRANMPPVVQLSAHTVPPGNMEPVFQPTSSVLVFAPMARTAQVGLRHARAAPLVATEKEAPTQVIALQDAPSGDSVLVVKMSAPIVLQVTLPNSFCVPLSAHTIILNDK